jgi:hypothetical protein
MVAEVVVTGRVTSVRTGHMVQIPGNKPIHHLGTSDNGNQSLSLNQKLASGTSLQVHGKIEHSGQVDMKHSTQHGRVCIVNVVSYVLMFCLL